MDIVQFPIRQTVIWSHAWSSFVPWYYQKVPAGIVRSYSAYALALTDIFSFRFLFSTLFSPWKNIRDTAEIKGFNIGLMAQAITLNLTARMIGFIFRIVTILIGTVFEVVLLAGFIVFFFLWLFFFPFILLWGIAHFLGF